MIVVDAFDVLAVCFVILIASVLGVLWGIGILEERVSRRQKKRIDEAFMEEEDDVDTD